MRIKSHAPWMYAGMTLAGVITLGFIGTYQYLMRQAGRDGWLFYAFVTPFVLVGVFSVTAASPALQGVRSTVTSGNGDYIVPLLAPGEYVVTFELAGFQSIRRERLTVAIAETAQLDVALALAGLSESVQVTGTAASAEIATGTTIATTYKAGVGGQGRITAILSPPDPANVAYRPCHFRKQVPAASRRSMSHPPACFA